MSVEVSVICDGCGMLGHAEKTAAAAREQLRAFGWRCSLAGGRDYCPDCIERGRDVAE